MSTQTDIHLARDGQIDSRNCARMGFDRIFQGTYGRPLLLSKDDEWQARRARFRRLVEAVVATYPGRVVVCGPSALQLLGVALPTSLENWDAVHVMVDPDVCRPRRPQVVSHQLRTAPVVWRDVDGIPVLHPVDCWLQLAGADDASLIEVADGLMRRRRPLLSLDAMNRRLADLQGAAGVKRCRPLMKWVRPGTESIYETRTRLVLVRGGLPCPVVNCEAPCPGTGFVYHVDMGYRAEKVAVEYDGAVHVGDVDQMELDAERRRHLQDAGWFIIPVTARQLRKPGEIVASVEAALVLRRAALR